MNHPQDDVVMLGFDEDRTVRDRQYSGLHHVHIRLDRRPDGDWIRLFDERRSFPRHSMWRAARVEGTYLIVVCALDELERYHLRDLRQDVEHVNRAYKDLVARRAAEEAAAVARESAERQHVADALGSIQFPGQDPD